MKEEAIELVSKIDDSGRRLNALREYMQVLVLHSLHECEAFKCLSFVGGTALRFLYNLPRFSEDLDFSLLSGKNYDVEKWMLKIKRDFILAGFNVSISLNTQKPVHSGWIRVRGILEETGLAAMQNQNLSIKLEVDTNPPKDARTENHVIERHRMFAVRCHDLPSLMAGKLRAIMTRKYQKGRDWYDFLWFLTRQPPVEPNPVFLQNSLNQAKGSVSFHGSDWKKLISEKIHSINFNYIRKDVAPFLEHPEEAAFITRENLLSVLLK